MIYVNTAVKTTDWILEQQIYFITDIQISVFECSDLERREAHTDSYWFTQCELHPDPPYTNMDSARTTTIFTKKLQPNYLLNPTKTKNTNWNTLF